MTDTAAAFLANLRSKGIWIKAAGGELELDGPEDVLTPELIASVCARKPELLELVAWEAETGDTIQETFRRVELGFPPEHVQGDAPLPTWSLHYRAIDEAVFTRNRQALEAALEAFENAARTVFNRWWTNCLDRVTAPTDCS